jgi:hypothetical protein
MLVARAMLNNLEYDCAAQDSYQEDGLRGILMKNVTTTCNAEEVNGRVAITASTSPDLGNTDETLDYIWLAHDEHPTREAKIGLRR